MAKAATARRKLREILQASKKPKTPHKKEPLVGDGKIRSVERSRELMIPPFSQNKTLDG